MRTGLIGLGARLGHIAALLSKQAPELEFTAFADPAPAGLAALEEAGIARPLACDNAQDMLAGGRFDLIMIGSPNRMHGDHLAAALRSDAPHIFVEKPVVATIGETYELATDIARYEGRSRLMVGLVLRYSPHYRALLQAIEAGQIGEVMSIEASEHIGPYHGSFFMRDWRRSAALSGGFMLEKCCHDLDIYQSVAGARAARVASFGGRKKFVPARRPAAPPAYLDVMHPRWNGISDAFSGTGDIVDYQTALVDYENGANLCFHTNLNVPDEFRRFAVIGTAGMAEGDFIRNNFRVTLSDSGACVVDEAALGSGALSGHYGSDAAMVRDIAAYLRNPASPLPVSVINAMEAGLTALAMDVARNAGRVEDLAPYWQRFDAALKGGHVS